VPGINARLIGVELYFDDLSAAKRFYGNVLGLPASDEQPDHHVQFDAGSAFLCLEKKGLEDYPSRDKAVIFLEVQNIEAAIESIGRERIVKHETGARHTSQRPWAVVHDPEGHNVLLMEASRPSTSQSE
jgi:predicted enzyme related to lactoylglutathione lyase